MHRDFVNTTKYIHENYLREARTRAERDALRHEARARKLRTRIGEGLIAIGERLREPVPAESLELAA